MSSTVFVNGVTLTDADWFNDMDRLHYTILQDPPDLATLRVTLGIGTTSIPALFIDGTLAAPGISWANETNSGITRLATNVMAVSVAGQNVMQWQPGHLFVNTALNLPNTGAMNFTNGAGNAQWEAFHAAANDTLHVGRIGWTSTTIYGAGVPNLVVTSSGVTLSGTIIGISGATIGLPNVANHRQVYELRNGANAIYIGWNGILELQVDGTYYGGTWPMNISGYSAVAQRLYANGQVGGTQMTFHWSGQGGQPSWLWGSNDGTNVYVYNPSNFSVNYANSANTANSASTAGNSNAVNGVSGWNYSNRAKNPVYLWATDGGSNDQFLTQPGNINVNYANSSNTANYANSAGTANALAGVDPGNYVRSDDHSVQTIRVFFDGEKWVLQVSGVNGTFGFYNYTGSGGVDGVRAKDDIADSDVDATAVLKAVRMIQFNDKLAGGQHVSVGFLPENLEEINPRLVLYTPFPGEDAPRDTRNVNLTGVLAYVVKALQETTARLAVLEAK